MPTQEQISQNIIEQLRALDPSISAEVGTPERRIIDTVAMSIADSQVDLNVLNGAFDINAKFGNDLDHMLSIFGFGRQTGTRATGYITFSRDTAATAPITIRSGTTVFTPTGGDGGSSVIFRTTATVTMQIGSTTVIAPIEAIQTGTIGNVATNAITEVNGSPIYGITGVTNPYPTTGGTDQESDQELKARFTTAGPFRNLAGTNDQFMSLALATKSKKATVIGPISKYNEYIQVPSESDADGGNADSTKTNQYTTELSTNVNSKHTYTDLPYFIINDSGGASVYYNADYDFIINTSPDAKNKGDSYRNSLTIDPTSTSAPVLYQPNVTFTNVYTGDINYRPDNSIAPGDVLLFEYSYLSNASRNDYSRNLLNCVDVYVDSGDLKDANTVIPRPGSNVPTFVFTVNDQYSTFYTDNFRRIDEPGHRPVSGNVFTPLYNQPVLELPDSISLTNGSFIKGIHYWLVEETTNLYGTVRARNGIEWSSTIPAKTNNDPDNGPYTGPLITDSSVSSTTLAQNIPSSISVSVQTVAQTYTITDIQINGNIVGLYIGTNFKLNVNDVIQITNLPNTYADLNLDNVKITNVDLTNGYITFTATHADLIKTSVGTGTVTVKSFASGNNTSIKVSSTDPFPSSGYLLIGSEIVAYTSKTGSGGSPANTFTISGRGQLGTTSANITASGATVNLLIQLASTIGIPTSDYLLIGSEQMSYTVPKSNSTSLVQITARGANSTNISSHSSGDPVSILLTSTDRVVTIDNYKYDDNIKILQASLDTNKQVTTDVLGHRANIRYFKPDFTVMYSTGANKTTVNNSIQIALQNYFNALYFASEIQLSDILQTIHNVAGVDNVRWSNEALYKSGLPYDDSFDARLPIVETNRYGDPISQPILDQIRIANGTNASKYYLYLPYISNSAVTTLSAPQGLSAIQSSTSGSLTATTYYYVVTALNDNGETTASDQASVAISSGGSATLTWSSVVGATEYKIYRSTSSGSGFKLLTFTGTNYYVDTGYPTGIDAPPTANTATNEGNLNVVSNFEIQYGNNAPIEIQNDDLLVQNYSSAVIYYKNDVVNYSGTYYVSLYDDNQGNDPSSSSLWQVDSNNKIGLGSKLNSNGTVVSISRFDGTNTFTSAPSFANPIVINYVSNSSKEPLVISATNVNIGYGAFDNDFQIGDGELASLPIGKSDGNGGIVLSSIMTVRVKSQNTWNTL
jgi:uncharacterized phage protein gp47/JayE